MTWGEQGNGTAESRLCLVGTVTTAFGWRWRIVSISGWSNRYSRQCGGARVGSFSVSRFVLCAGSSLRRWCQGRSVFVWLALRSLRRWRGCAVHERVSLRGRNQNGSNGRSSYGWRRCGVTRFDFLRLTGGRSLRARRRGGVCAWACVVGSRGGCIFSS